MRKIDAYLDDDRFYLAFRGYGYSDRYERFGESTFIRGTVRLMLKWAFGGRERYYQASVSNEDFKLLERNFCLMSAREAADWADDALKRHGIHLDAKFRDANIRERFYAALK